MDREAVSTLPVVNWLQLANISETHPAVFDLELFGQAGSPISAEAVTLAPRERLDLPAGTLNPGPGHVGLVKVTPRNTSLPYLARINRYSGTGGNALAAAYHFALSTSVHRGFSGPRYSTFAPSACAMRWIVVANGAATESSAAVQTIQADGTAGAWSPLVLPAHAQAHLYVDSLLSAGAAGTVAVVPVTGTVLVEEQSYYFTEGGQVSGAFGGQASRLQAVRLYSGYNTFLNQTNSLVAYNAGSAAITLTLEAYDRLGLALAQTDLLLPANSSLEFPLAPVFSSAITEDTYGLLKVTPGANGGISARLLRRSGNAGTCGVQNAISLSAR